MRPPVAIGHYKMIKHKGDKGNEQNPRRYLQNHWSLFLTEPDGNFPCFEKCFWPFTLTNKHFVRFAAEDFSSNKQTNLI